MRCSKEMYQNKENNKREKYAGCCKKKKKLPGFELHSMKGFKA